VPGSRAGDTYAASVSGAPGSLSIYPRGWDPARSADPGSCYPEMDSFDLSWRQLTASVELDLAPLEGFTDPASEQLGAPEEAVHGNLPPETAEALGTATEAGLDGLYAQENWLVRAAAGPLTNIPAASQVRACHLTDDGGPARLSKSAVVGTGAFKCFSSGPGAAFVQTLLQQYKHDYWDTIAQGHDTGALPGVVRAKAKRRGCLDDNFPNRFRVYATVQATGRPPRPAVMGYVPVKKSFRMFCD
jgi:hypothetical protein